MIIYRIIIYKLSWILIKIITIQFLDFFLIKTMPKISMPLAFYHITFFNTLRGPPFSTIACEPLKSVWWSMPKCKCKELWTCNNIWKW